jgi:hypothetical protein
MLFLLFLLSLIPQNEENKYQFIQSASYVTESGFLNNSNFKENPSIEYKLGLEYKLKDSLYLRGFGGFYFSQRNVSIKKREYIDPYLPPEIHMFDAIIESAMVMFDVQLKKQLDKDYIFTGLRYSNDLTGGEIMDWTAQNRLTRQHDLYFQIGYGRDIKLKSLVFDDGRLKIKKKKMSIELCFNISPLNSHVIVEDDVNYELWNNSIDKIYSNIWSLNLVF